MNRGTMRAVLRRRINDPTNGYFTDGQLDEILNDAAAKIQSKILVNDPQAFLQVTRTPLLANQDLYPKPLSLGALLDVRKLNSDTGRYVSLGRPVDLVDLELFTTSSRYAFFGTQVKLSWRPEVEEADGLEWWGVMQQTIESGAGFDGQSYSLPLSLHNGVVNQAALLTASENDAGFNAEEVRKQLIEDLAEASTYRRTINEELPFQIPGVVKRGAGQ